MQRSGAPANSSSGKLLLHCAEALMQQGNPLKILSPFHQSADAARNGSWSTHHPITGGELAIALLPLMLFFHEDVGKLRQVLALNLATSQKQPGVYPEVLAIAYAISRALRERLHPANFLAKVIHILEQGEPEFVKPADNLIAQFKQVDILLKQHASLQQVMAQLLDVDPTKAECSMMPMAFYCFLSTPNDFHLSLARAAQAGLPSQFFCTLTGALSAACNSFAAIPLSWKLACFEPTYLLPWGISSSALMQLASRLYALWSGAYDPKAFSETAGAIAAPGIIRPR
jgi:ADP-ribosylglycohydrolase